MAELSHAPSAPAAETHVPRARVLLDVLVLGVGVGCGIVLLRTELTPVYAWLLFLFAALALVDIAVVVRRTARGEPTVIEDPADPGSPPG
jgi:uncharacterized membrane protein YccC